MKNIGIVICSRSDSRRVPKKPFLEVNGKPILIHLIDRLFFTGISIFLAVPEEQKKEYQEFISQRKKASRNYRGGSMITLVTGSKSDPMRRTFDVATKYNLDTIIRVTHDKIFIDYRQVNYFINHYVENNLDYLFSTNFIDGMSFEIFDISVLETAINKFKDVEHLSFALDAVAKNKKNLKTFPYSLHWSKRHGGKRLRLLLDYPEDIEMLEGVLKKYGNEVQIEELIKIPDHFITNTLPEVSIYTCSYNSHEFLDECVASVLSQADIDFEYMLIDDGSTDWRVYHKMLFYSKLSNRIKFIRNRKNQGLASASNIALREAQAKYIIRLDADDYFYTDFTVRRMLDDINKLNIDVLYPHNLAGDNVQYGYDRHHVGGSLFRKKALDYLEFTDGLRHYEGLDLFNRIKERGLTIGYFNEISFFYRQRHDSLSNNKSPERIKIEQRLKSGLTGKALLE